MIANNGNRDEVASQLATVIKQRLGGRVTDLCVGVEDRGIVLRGRTGSYYTKQLAQEAAMHLTALPICANAIEVAAQ